MLEKKKNRTLHTKASLFFSKASKQSKILQVLLVTPLSPYRKMFALNYCTTNTDSLLLLYSRYIVFVWTLYCLLHVNGLLTMYGVMRPWVQGQPWYMRVKIGLCCTDDLISIFRDLGMEMTLFTFKCFVLAPGLLYLCLIPDRGRNRTLHTETSAPGWLVWTRQITTIHCRHSKVYGVQRERERESIRLALGVTFIFPVQLTWCMHWRK